MHRLLAVEALGADNWVLRLEGPFEAALPGQFCMLSLAEGWPVLLPRPFSYLDLEPGARGLATFLVKVVGPGTRALVEAPPGTPVRVTGPLGRGFPEPAAGTPEPVCIAGGVGLAPFLLWARARQRVGAAPLPLLYGGATAAAIVGQDQFPAGAQDWHLSTDDGSLGFHGNVLELYRSLAAAGRVDGRAPVLCCGPDPMMHAVARDCAEAGRPCLVSLETWMACGYGVCNGCSVGVHDRGRLAGRRWAKACVHGPVFDAAELDW
ncbi:MAG: dihydroorotate dehydrogenase electron transfer subunit [Planctomycetota bacterium]